MKVRTLAVIFAAAVVSASAHASSMSGAFFANATTTSAPSSTAGLNQTASFTVSGPLDLFNFSSFGNLSNTGNSGLDYTLGSFLTSNGDTVAYNGTGASHANDGINNSVFEFTGSTYLAAGTYTFTHDDGMFLYLNGNAVISSPGVTAPVPSSFVITAGNAGIYNFDLIYAEVSGPGAVLESPNFPVATPEPTSFVMLGSGLLAGAGMIRRRMKA